MLSVVFPKNIFLKGTRKTKLSNQHHSMVVCRNMLPLYWLILLQPESFIFQLPIHFWRSPFTHATCSFKYSIIWIILRKG